MPDVLPGFSFDTRASRYRNLSTGRFTPRSRGPNAIVRLLERSVDQAEDRLSNIVQGLAAGEVAPGVAQMAMRDELRRLSLQNSALGRGGFDRLTAQDYGRVGRQLRDSYARMSNMLNGVANGSVSLSQALNRISGYTLDARRQFFAAEREAMRATGRQMEGRRHLHARESCVDCIRLAGLGWQAAELVPLPGQGARCGSFCRCSIEYREVVAEVRERIAA